MHAVRIERDGRVAVVRATGEVDAFVAPELEAAFEELAGEAFVVADLVGVSFMDSTALGVLVRVARTRTATETATRIVLPVGTARRIFEITALDRALPVAASRASAVEDVASPAN